VAAATVVALACGRADSIDERLADIRTRQDEGKAAETLAELTELGQRDGENPELNYRLGLAMIASGRPTEAVFPLHKAAENDEWVVPAGLLLASTLANTDNHSEALRAADRVLAKDPEHEAALLLRATSASQLHDGPVALESAERLVEKAPDNRNYAFVRASALAEVDRLDDAEKAYRELLEADWENEPQGKVRACGSFARFLVEKRKDSPRAVELMKKCVDQSPEDIQMVAALGNMLNEFELQEDLISILEDAVERHPDARALRQALIGQLVSVNRLDEASKLAEDWAAEADDAQAWGQVATVRRRQGDLEGSLAAVDKALSASKGESEEGLNFFRSELLLEQGKLDDAEREATKIHDELSRTILDARLAQQRGDQKKALELYGKVSIQWPQNHAVRALAARAAYQLGDTERAKSDLLEATRQAAKETDAALWIAQIYFAEGNFRQCLAFASRHVHERGVNDPTAHLLMAEALLATNRPEPALKMLDELAAARDGAFRTVAWAAAARIEARTDAAKGLAGLEKHVAEARLDLSDPANTHVLDTLLDLQLRSGRSADAARRLSGLLAKRPDSAHLNAMLGRVALAEGRRDDAQKSFEKALSLQATDAVALSGMALLHREDDPAKAIEWMKQAAVAAPDNPDYAYMSARMTLETGDRAAGRQQLEQVLLEHPDAAGAANDLAFLLAEDATDLTVAQRHAERAVRLQPSAETLDTLGFVKLKQGAAEEAVGMFERALSRKPDYATARYHLALAEARKVLAKIDGGEARP
jgi:tetratricopeptide (TPR) repeat protein